MQGSEESNRRSEVLAAMLSDIAPLLRSRIRARRGARIPHIGTSDIYASVARRVIELERKDGLSALDSSPSAAAPPTERRGLLRLLHLLIDRVIVDAKRREKAQERAMREFASPSTTAPDAQPDAASLSAEERALVASLVESLGESDRELLSLRLSGRDWAEVARETGSTEAACRQRFHRLTGELARLLGAE